MGCQLSLDTAVDTASAVQVGICYVQSKGLICTALYRNMLHSTETCYTIQKHATLYRNMLHSTETCYTIQKHVTLYGNMLHSTETCYTLQKHATLYRNMLLSAETCYTLQNMLLCRNMLHSTETCYTLEKHAIQCYGKFFQDSQGMNTSFQEVSILIGSK